MSLIDQLFPRVRAGGADIPAHEERAWGAWAPATAAGVGVNADTALKIGAVWACVRLISDSVAMLPLIVYRRLDNGDRERATNHPLYSLLHDQPNATQTAYQFRKMLTAHLLLRGNAYAEIVPGARGFVDQLRPLHPDRMRVEPLPDGRVRYKYRQPNGIDKPYTDDEIFHLRGLSLDGVRGLGVIEYAREIIGTEAAREQYGARYFGNGARPDGVLKTAGKLSPGGAERMAADWKAVHQGPFRSHKIAVLEEGLEYQAMSLSNKDSQFLELAEVTAETIAGQFFGVPPHMIGLTSKATSWGSGIEEMGNGFVTYTLLPWLTEWEQSISRDLVLATQRYFVEHITDALLKGRLLDRYSAYQIARNIGLMNPNEMRQRENMNRREDSGGDEYLETPNGATPSAAPEVEDDPADNAQAAHYLRLLAENAGRVVRKEIAAVGRAIKRADAAEQISEFYAGHGAFVAETMQITQAAAAQYVAERVAELARVGPERMANWDTERVAALVNLALKDG